MDNPELEQFVADAVMERPYGFTVNDSHFFLYPITIGKMYVLRMLVGDIGVDQTALQENPYKEAIRIATEKKEECLSVICYHTCKDKDEVFDTGLLEERKELFRKELTDEDIASLMIIALTTERTEQFSSFLGIDKEQERMNRVMRVKKSKNDLVFGGKSVYGGLIDIACERYGWTFDYVVWGISYTNLRLLLADKVTSIYLTDDEMKKVPASIRNKDDDVIKATKDTKEMIKAMDWT